MGLGEAVAGLCWLLMELSKAGGILGWLEDGGFLWLLMGLGEEDGFLCRMLMGLGEADGLLWAEPVKYGGF